MVSATPDVLSRAVSQRVVEAFDARSAALADLEPGRGDLIGVGQALLSGGKRLRARLCGLGWRAGGQSLPADLGAAHPVVLAGSALELFQGAALAHDDIIDRSELRRGEPAAHRRLAALHADASWLGDADHFGTSGALLLGDLLLNTASMEIDDARLRVDADASRRARAIWDLMAMEVSIGQYLDLRSQAQPWGIDPEPVETAVRVVVAKSARYSVEHPLNLGAALAGADDHLVAKLAEASRPLGIAFQLRDDELGVFGEPSLTGKPAGGDLREGKRTVLLALTSARVDGAAADLLHDTIGRDDLTADEIIELQNLIESSGARNEHEALIARHADEGRERLDHLDAPADVIGDILATFEALITRRS